MKPDLRTPAGASVYLRRTRWHTRITIDRWPIADATETQCAAVYDLFVQEWADHLQNSRSKHRKGIAFLAQPSIWEGLVRRERESEVLRALIDIEANPAEPVLMTYNDEPQPVPASDLAPRTTRRPRRSKHPKDIR